MAKVRAQFDGYAVGRIVQGDPWEARTKDQDGKLLVNANGEPSPKFVICVAFPKLLDGKPNEGFAYYKDILDKASRQGWPDLFPNGGDCVINTFSNKVRDGDGRDSKGKLHADKEGFAGHWVVTYSNAYAPKIVQKVNGVLHEITDKARLKRGDWVRVSGSVADNGSSQQPGMFVNMDHIEFIQAGEAILGGRDAEEAFAREVVMPSGMTSPAATQAPPAATQAPPAAPPSASFIPAPVMTAAANGVTHAQYVAAGWSDQQLIEAGFMVA